MKILFVYSLQEIQSTVKPLRSWATIQFGISYISSVLKENNHQTRLLVLGNNMKKDSIKMLELFMEDFNPGIICFTAVFSQYFFIKETAELIKNRWPDKFLIIGGVHTTLNPDEVIKGPFDALCIGEGEYPTLELCDQLEEGKLPPQNIKNLWIKSHKGEIEKNNSRNFIQDLDTLPLPDRGMWEPWMKEQKGSEIAILLGRGCPYSCTYCSNHALRKIAGGKYVRMRSTENIINEIDFINEKYPHRKIYFEVETIALDKEWALDLCSKIEAYNKKIDNAISYGCNFRITRQPIYEELFIAFKKANFYKINIGLESGSERVRREILKRNYSNSDFIKTVSLARKYGLKVFVYNMIGLPGESLAEHMETVQLNRLCQPDGNMTGIFFPYPGTELYKICIEQGLLDKESVNLSRLERSISIITLPEFTHDQIMHAYTWFNFRVYKGHKPFWIVLLNVAVVIIRSHPNYNFLFRKIAQWPIFRQLREIVSKS